MAGAGVAGTEGPETAGERAAAADPRAAGGLAGIIGPAVACLDGATLTGVPLTCGRVQPHLGHRFQSAWMGNEQRGHAPDVSAAALPPAAGALRELEALLTVVVGAVGSTSSVAGRGVRHDWHRDQSGWLLR